MIRGFTTGFTVALLVCIAYDTSANAAPLEGGQRHLTFGAILVISLVAGAVGALVHYRGRPQPPAS